MKHTVIAAPLRREEALAFIIQRIIRTGTSPSYDEIGRALAISKTRAKELVTQLIHEGILEKTPGAQRSLRVRDLVHCREIVAHALRMVGYVVAEPLGTLQPPFPQGQLPMLPEIEHLPEVN